MTTATYSPSDNKIRLYPDARLDTETYQRVRDAGFSWAPKQELFVCPRWTPAAEDMAIEMAGEIDDEDTTPEERAEARAARFEGYQGKRSQEAEQARKGVAAIADNIPFGQPILVGHHSERHARRDAEKIENGMRRTIKLFETAQYWKDRAASAIAHAKYLEVPAVRARRIKTIEADKRKREREKEEAQALVRFWSGETFATNRATGEKHKLDINEENRELLCHMLGQMRASGVSFRGVDGTLWYSAFDCLRPESERYENCPAKTVSEVKEAALRIQATAIANCDRWIAHLENRLVYERAMLGETGGLKADKFDLQPGGQILRRGKWCIITKVNRSDGAIRSVSVLGHFASTIQIEDVTDYRPPVEGMAEKVKAATKLPPMCNYPGEGFKHQTTEEYNAHFHQTHHHKATDAHGAHRTRGTVRGGNRIHVYLTDAKRVDPPAPSAPAELPELETLPPEPRSAPRETPPADPVAADLAAMKATLKAGVQVVSAPQLFPTPPELAARMVELADLKPGLTVLEPSAGTGNIAKAILDAVDTEVLAYEINSDLCLHLRRTFPSWKLKACCQDFLEVTDFQGHYPRILMNPPFTQGQDIAEQPGRAFVGHGAGPTSLQVQQFGVRALRKVHGQRIE